jgi:hypothetical protein
MPTPTHELVRPHEAHPAAVRQAARHALHADELLRDAVRRELEAEMRGLIMAARVHGFNVAIAEGKPVVTRA